MKPDKIQKIRVANIRKEYRRILHLVGQKEIISDAIREARGDWESAVELLRVSEEFSPREMEFIYGE